VENESFPITAPDRNDLGNENVAYRGSSKVTMEPGETVQPFATMRVERAWTEEALTDASSTRACRDSDIAYGIARRDAYSRSGVILGSLVEYRGYEGRGSDIESVIHSQ